jgi:hypothetical protein
MEWLQALPLEFMGKGSTLNPVKAPPAEGLAERRCAP